MNFEGAIRYLWNGKPSDGSLAVIRVNNDRLNFQIFFRNNSRTITIIPLINYIYIYTYIFEE